GLPAGRHRRRVQGRPYSPAGRTEGIQVSDTEHTADHAHDIVADADPYAAELETTQRRVYTDTSGDWHVLVAAVDTVLDERLIVTPGPQHPSTHGVLRLVCELEGETVRSPPPVIGYLHTGIEKNLEYRTWTQGCTFVTRADYLAPIFN